MCKRRLQLTCFIAKSYSGMFLGRKPGSVVLAWNKQNHIITLTMKNTRWTNWSSFQVYGKHWKRRRKIISWMAREWIIKALCIQWIIFKMKHIFYFGKISNIDRRTSYKITSVESSSPSQYTLDIPSIWHWSWRTKWQLYCFLVAQMQLCCKRMIKLRKPTTDFQDLISLTQNIYILTNNNTADNTY